MRVPHAASMDHEMGCYKTFPLCLHIARTDASLRELAANWHRLTPSVGPRCFGAGTRRVSLGTGVGGSWN